MSATHMSYGEYTLKKVLYYHLGSGSQNRWKFHLAWEIVSGLIEDGMGTIDNGDVYITEGYADTLHVEWSRARWNSADEHHFRCDMFLGGNEILYTTLNHIQSMSDIHCTIPRALKYDMLRDASNSGWLVPVMERLRLC